MGLSPVSSVLYSPCTHTDTFSHSVQYPAEPCSAGPLYLPPHAALRPRMLLGLQPQFVKSTLMLAFLPCQKASVTSHGAGRHLLHTQATWPWQLLLMLCEGDKCKRKQAALPPVCLNADSSSLRASRPLEASAWLLQKQGYLADVLHASQQILHRGRRTLCYALLCHFTQLLQQCTWMNMFTTLQ